MQIQFGLETEYGITRERPENIDVVEEAIAVVRSAPHTEAAEKLFHYLQNRAVLDRLVAAHALESADGQVSSDEGQTLRVDWDSLLQNLEPATAVLKTIFLR